MAEQTTDLGEQLQAEHVFDALCEKFRTSDRFSSHFDAGVGNVYNAGRGFVFTYRLGDVTDKFVEINKYGRRLSREVKYDPLSKDDLDRMERLYGILPTAGALSDAAKAAGGKEVRREVVGEGKYHPLSKDDLDRMERLYNALQTAGALSDAAKAAGGKEVSGEVAGETFKLGSATNAANQTVTIVERRSSAYLITESLDYPIAKANSKNRQEGDKKNVIRSIRKVQLPEGNRFDIETEDTYPKSNVTKEDIDYLAKVPHSLKVTQPV